MHSTMLSFRAPESAPPPASQQRPRRTEKAPWNPHRAEWIVAYRRLRKVRGRAIHWLHRAARVRKGYTLDPRSLARAVLSLVRADWPRYDNPMMCVLDFGTTASEEDVNRMFALHVSNDTPRPIPLGTIAWALGSLAWWIIEERYATKLGEDGNYLARVDETRSTTRNHLYRAVPTMREADRRPKDTRLGWFAERVLCRMIADELVGDYQRLWPEEHRADVRRDWLAARRRVRAALAEAA